MFFFGNYFSITFTFCHAFFASCVSYFRHLNLNYVFLPKIVTTAFIKSFSFLIRTNFIQFFICTSPIQYNFLTIIFSHDFILFYFFSIVFSNDFIYFFFSTSYIQYNFLTIIFSTDLILFNFFSIIFSTLSKNIGTVFIHIRSFFISIGPGFIRVCSILLCANFIQLRFFVSCEFIQFSFVFIIFSTDFILFKCCTHIGHFHFKLIHKNILFSILILAFYFLLLLTMHQ